MENRVKKITIIFENVKLFLNSEAIQKDKLVQLYTVQLCLAVLYVTSHKTLAFKCFVVWKEKPQVLYAIKDNVLSTNYETDENTCVNNFKQTLLHEF